MSQTERTSATTEVKSERPSLMERLRSVFGLEAPSIRHDIEDALEDNGHSSEFTNQEKVILKNVLSLHDLRVADVMVPRADIIAVSLEASLEEVLHIFRTAEHSRLPVHGDTLDDPRGMIHIRDFVDYIAANAEAGRGKRSPLPKEEGKGLMRVAGHAGIDLATSLADAKIIRSVLYAPPSMPVLDLLVRMQTTRTHMALVIDEYGGTDGLVSLEDIVEMVVGDIEDEHDTDERPRIEKASDGSFIANARVDLEDMGSLLGLDLFVYTEGDEVHTLGGLVTAIAGKVPARGEILDVGGALELEVLDADPRRVKRVRLRRLSEQAEPKTPSPPTPDIEVK